MKSIMFILILYLILSKKISTFIVEINTIEIGKETCSET